MRAAAIDSLCCCIQFVAVALYYIHGLSSGECGGGGGGYRVR